MGEAAPLIEVEPITEVAQTTEAAPLIQVETVTETAPVIDTEPELLIAPVVQESQLAEAILDTDAGSDTEVAAVIQSAPGIEATPVTESEAVAVVETETVKEAELVTTEQIISEPAEQASVASVPTEVPIAAAPLVEEILSASLPVTEEPAPEIKADLKEIKQDKKQKRQQKSKRKSESERKSECEKDTLDSAVPEEEIVPTVEEKLELLHFWQIFRFFIIISNFVCTISYPVHYWFVVNLCHSKFAFPLPHWIHVDQFRPQLFSCLQL